MLEDGNGKGWIVTMNMDMMLHAVDLPPELQPLAKRVRDTIYSIVDAGVNLLFTSTWYQHDILPAEAKEGLYEETVIYGPLCMNIDVVDDAIMLPPLPRGTHLTLSPVGAYNVTQWMQFITLRPRVVMIDPEAHVHIIRESENLDKLLEQERVPQHLEKFDL